MIDKEILAVDSAALLAIAALLLLSVSMRKRPARAPRPVPMKRKRRQWQPVRLMPGGWSWDARRAAPAGWVPWLEAPQRDIKGWRWVSPRVYGVTTRMEPARTPSAGTLDQSIAQRSDGSAPPWIEKGSAKPPAGQFVEWFNAILQSGSPHGWDAAAFTADAVAIDPLGAAEGAQAAASGLLRMLRHFPELRGEVISWAANEEELLIDWRLRLRHHPDRPPLLTTIADRFRFTDGRICFRLSNFDLVNLTAYLAESGHGWDIYEFYAESRERTGESGVRVLPRTLWAVAAELLRWRIPVDRSGLRAKPGDGSVTLEWRRRNDAISYRVYRAASLCGPYQLAGETETNRYVDAPLNNGTPYWYVVAARPRNPKFRSVRRDESVEESLRG